MICRKCKHWVATYTKIVGEDEYFVGECRIRSVAANSFPERFDYESCAEFLKEQVISEEVKQEIKTEVTEASKRAIEFIENTKRPAARALSSEWDEYIDNIKKILQGE